MYREQVRETMTAPGDSCMRHVTKIFEQVKEAQPPDYVVARSESNAINCRLMLRGSMLPQYFM